MPSIYFSRQKSKIEFVNTKYNTIKDGVLEAFDTTEKILEAAEVKSLLSLQRILLLVTAGRILRLFLALPKSLKAKLVGDTLKYKFGGSK